MPRVRKSFVLLSARAPGALGLLIACASASAQDSAGTGRSLSIVPSFSTSASVVDTRRPSGARTSDAVLQLQPGLRVSSSSGRVRGTLQYSMSGVVRSASNGGSEVYNALNAAGSAELIPAWAYLDASATVSQQALSAYGQQSATVYSNNRNLTEVATVSVSPYLRGFLGPALRYEARVTASGVNARRSKAGDSSGEAALLSVGSATSGLLGWGVDLTSDRRHFRLSRDTQVDRALGTLSIRPDPEYGFTLRAGQERSDALSLEQRSYNNWGAGARWTPTERTAFSSDYDRRYFGNAYSLQLTHRLPLSSFRIASSRSATTGANAGSQSQAVTLYQLYDLLLASRFPDPVQRDIVVRQLLGTRDPNTLVQGGFVDSGVSVSRRDDIGWTYTRLRLSLNLLAFRSSTQRLDILNPAANGDAIRQQGYTAVVSYQLSPTASLSANGTLLQTPGTAFASGTNLKTASLSWTDFIGNYTSVSVSGRYSVFNSTTDPYREAALTASLSLRF